MHYTSREVYEYISKQTNDPIVEWKVCAISGTQFPIYQSDLDFYAKISPTFGGTKFQIPTPTLCPEERQRRRLLFRNERKLYRRTCDFSGKEIISNVSPDKPHKVYDHKIWRSDARDPMDYGRDFDFTKSFTEQFGELSLQVPMMSLFITPDATENNCSYVNSAGLNKNCYFIFDSDQNEDCMYSNGVKDSKNCLEITVSMKCEYCYELIYCIGCYNCQYCMFDTFCTNCISCRSCVSCSDCYGCYGIKNKQYCIFNKQYSQEEYQALLPTVQQKEYLQLDANTILPGTHNAIQTCENIIGSYLAYSKNITCCYDCSNLRDSKYSDGIMNGISDLYDHSSFGEESNRTLECEGTGRRVSNILFSQNIFLDSRDILYSKTCCQGCHHCFGCIGLRQKSYCILNKQYSKDDYEKVVAKIIAHMQLPSPFGRGVGGEGGEWGEFFDSSLSLFGYNETIAQEYFPLTREQAIERGYTWQDHNYDPKIPDHVEVIKPQDYSNQERKELKNDDIITKHIILCSESNRPFRILKQELDFYRKHNLELPKFHPDIRHAHRLKLKPSRSLFLRNCDNCNKEILSVYPVIARSCEEGSKAIHTPMDRHVITRDDQVKVYCEECYQKEMYA